MRLRRAVQTNFSLLQFASQAAYLIAILGVAAVAGWNGGGADDVRLAQASQAINAVWIALFWIASWRRLDHVPAVTRPLATAGGARQCGWWTIATAGFRQVFATVRRIHRDYRSSLGTFLLAVVFAEASANAFTVVSVIYLNDAIGLTSAEIGIFFFVALVGTMPGSQLGGLVTHRINPKNSWRLCLSLLTVVAIIGALGLSRGGSLVPVLVWGFFVGVMLGWHYPTQALIFSLCLPKGQDSELAGFFVYCTQILVWLPPLVFAALVQRGVDQKWGVVAVSVFGVAAVLIISALPAWPAVLADVARFDDDPHRIVEAAADTNEETAADCCEASKASSSNRSEANREP